MMTSSRFQILCVKVFIIDNGVFKASSSCLDSVVAVLTLPLILTIFCGSRQDLLSSYFVDCSRYIWESKADGNFAVTEDTENESLGRGTEIRIHLKSDAAEYTQEDKLKVRRLEIANGIATLFLY